MDWSETTTWADAMAFCWSRRQMWSSWTDSMPGICFLGTERRKERVSQPYRATRKEITRKVTYLLEVVLHVVNFHAPGRALQQNGPRVLGEWDGAEEDHQGDEHARRRVRVEARVALGLPDDDGGDDDANVVDGVADDVDQDAHHAEVVARLLKLGHVVTVLRVGVEDGLCAGFVSRCV